MRMDVIAVVAMLAGLSGCMNHGGNGTPSTDAATFDPSGLSAKQFDIQAPQELWTTSSVDGKRLESVVYLPKTDDKVPVFINFSPYWGDTATTEGDNFAHYMIHEYVPRGYAVVLSAIRGTGHSEGCFQIGGDVELQDTRDVIDAMASQAWSTGAVVAGGKSYDSTTQNGVIAKFPTDHLKGIFHVSGITDMYRYNARAGVPYFNGLDFTPRYAVSQGTDEYGTPVGTGGGSSSDEDAASLARLADDAACPQTVDHVAGGEGTAATGLKDAYWQERDWVSALPSSNWNGSVYFVHGLQDWNVKPDDIDPWVDILQAKGLHVLGWLHQERDNGGHLYPMRDDWNQTMLRWLDATLKGKDTGMDQLWGFEVQGSDGTWRRSEAWPPATAVLTAKPSAGASPVEFVKAGPGGLRVVGAPSLFLQATTMSADAVLRAQLVRVNGTVATRVNEAVLRANLADDLTTPSPVAPGTTRAYNLSFYPMDLELPEGQSLAVIVGFAQGDLATPNGLATDANFFVTPSQQIGTTYDLSKAVFTYDAASLDSGLAVQPNRTPCFAC